MTTLLKCFQAEIGLSRVDQPDWCWFQAHLLCKSLLLLCFKAANSGILFFLFLLHVLQHPHIMTGSTAPCIFVWEFQQSIKNRARDSESQHWLPKSGSRIWFWVCWLKWQKLLEWCVPPHRTPIITSPPSKLRVCMCVWGEQMIVIPVTHRWWPHNYANDHRTQYQAELNKHK